MYHKEFQPLRIFPGWKVTYNFFYQEQITEENIHGFEGPTLLTVESSQRNQFIDISWLPEGDISGCYVLEMYNTREIFIPEKNSFKWDYDDEPHTVFKSKAKQEIVDKLEYLMWYGPIYEDPRILENRGVVSNPSESYRIALEADGLTDKLINKILADGNKDIQCLVLDHPDLTRDIILLFIDESQFNKVKNVAATKLKQKRFR